MSPYVGGRSQRCIATRAADQGLRCAVGRFDQAHLALQPSQRQHAVLPQRGGELLGSDAVDLMSAIGNEVEDEAHFPKLFGKRFISSSLIPVVSQLNDGERL